MKETKQTECEASSMQPLSTGRFGRIVQRIEEIFFTVTVLAMIVLGLIPIILRLAGMSGIVWIAPLTRYFVLIIALLGAGTAVRERSSISVDIISQLLSERKRLILRATTELISAAVCVVFAWTSIRFVADFDRESIAFLQIPEWYLALILPIGFILLILRLLIAAWEDFRAAVNCQSAKIDSPEGKRS